MNRCTLTPLLRWALSIDAAASGLVGLILCASPQALGGLLDLPPNGLLGVGVICIAYASVVTGMARRRSLPEWSVWVVVIGNLIWSIDSVLLAFSGWITPNSTGLAVLLGQAMLTFAFADLQYLALRRARRADEMQHAPA